MKRYSQYLRGVCAACFCVMGLFAGPVAAQNFGILGGLTFTSADEIHLNDVETSLDNHTGYHVGAYIDFGSQRLRIRPGVEYVSAGPLFDGVEDGLPSAVDDDFDVHLFAVPVDVRLEFGPSFTRPYVFAGPVAHFRWLADAPDEFEDNVKGRDIAGSVGAGVRIGGQQSNLRIVPQVRYTFGLSSVLEESFTIGDVTLAPADNMSFLLVSVALEF